MTRQSNPGWSKRLSAGLSANLPKTLKRGMGSVETEAKRIVYLGRPDHLDRRTGTLQKSISTEVSVSGPQVSATVGTSLVYAPTHEFGAAIPHANGSISFIPARPFLSPAFAAKKDEVRALVSGTVVSAIKEECR